MSQPDPNDEQMDRLAKNYEKNFDKAFSAVEKGANALDKVQQGCWLVGINLFLCAFFGWGVFAALNAIRVEGQETTSATVVELNESNDPELGRRYTSEVEYEVDGRTYSDEVGEPSIPAEYEVGETLTVRYSPNAPGAAEADSFIDRWLFPVIIIPAMLITAAILNFLAIRAWRRGEDLDLGDE
jgi:hypothetical protein